jgi:hypothetical protein
MLLLSGAAEAANSASVATNKKTLIFRFVGDSHRSGLRVTGPLSTPGLYLGAGTFRIDC